ncbi:hypothetical protein PENSPDRAFT_131821 [Peniophora sp. CONT]|nr:hypothetical protein PENSPDRAFT_131821 [Peniophora sp. CONT]
MECPLASSDPLQAPVYRLDTDSLAMIFYHAVRDERSAYEEFTRLVCVTHVCQQWREVGLSLAELWGDVACACSMRLEAFDIVIGRAHNAPLRVPKMTRLRTMQNRYFLAQPQRFRELHSLECNWSSAILAGERLPHLETATLAVTDDGGGSTQPPVHAPVLEELSLIGCCIPFDAPSLKSLELATSAPLRLSQLITMLNGLPTLSSLTLRDALPEDPIQHDDLGRIHLPSLTRMHLVGSCLSLETFLQQLRPTNPDAATTIYIRDANHTDDLVRLFEALQPYLGGSSRDTIYINPSDYQFFLAYRHSDVGNRGTLSNAWGGVSLELDTWLGNLGASYATLVEQFTICQIRHLKMRVLENTGDNFLANMSMPDVLQVLRVPQLAVSVQTLYHSLATDSDMILDDPQSFASIVMPFFQFDSPTPWPQLEELTLAGDWPLFLHTNPDGVACVQSWLEGRAASGCPLRTLRLRTLSFRRIVTETDGDEPKYNDEAWNRIRALVSVEIEEI